MSVDEHQFVNLKVILDIYAKSTGLEVNFSKSSLVPINVEPQNTSTLGVLQLTFPQLFSFVQNKKISVKIFLSQDAHRMPLSIIAADQLVELVTLVQGLDGDGTLIDQWSYIRGNGDYISRKAYLQLRGSVPISPVYKWMWKSCSRGTNKFTFWLLLRNRLNTRNILRRKRRILDDYSCPLCASNSEETMVHLFFTCRFSTWCCTFF